MQPIPVIALTGYLGAGKTTLLNHVLRSPDARIGVVINDFGELNVDAGLVTGQVDEPASIAGGCICCLPDDGGLDVALARLADPKLRLDAIIVEAAPAFPIGQIAMVDRTILRIALYEVLFNNAAVPIGAVINDAVELAKTFGSDASRRFVNGVLGTVSRQRLPDLMPKPPPNPGTALEEALAAPKAETEEPSGAL